ncbi:hypothetical protein L6452_26268 [Arctium lappa]|uniref:Uncharacterized protein n=1 Tax=Arctium lappa TaxID=4217 RepID=A0ACB9AD31_ARCLA|nr:hypothetical protein L6452_26268 [Arctium lappa]
MALLPPPTQTLDQDLSFCPQKVGENHPVLGPGEPLLSPLTGEDNVVSQPSGPLIVDDGTNDHVDETEEWISYHRSDTEVGKPLHLVASGSSNDVERPPLVGAGLANLGNTCFLNAVLQCFTHTVLLVQGLYSYTHATPCDCNDVRLCLFCALWEHIDLSLLSTRKIVFPMKFVDNLGYFSSSFRRYQQEDAHEFLQCFLDRLESSCNFLKPKDVPFYSTNDNLVKQVFGGRVVSKLRCCNCNHCSDTYEPSVDLSLEIEDANNLSTALESFTKVEHLEDEEMKFTCENCNQKVSVEKQLMLDQIPLVCALHLKRFKNDGCYVEKIDKHVEFPLELDLQPYTCVRQASNVDLKFDLYAVVVHATFTSTCGHYYCYIRSAPDTWYKFDDSKVTKVSEGHVLSEEAYILFYTRQGTPSFSNFMETYKLSVDRTLSNTSPKSVLDNVDDHCTSPYTSNYHSHNVIDTSKAGHIISPESFDRSKYNRAKVAGPKDPPQTYTPIPLEASNFSAPPALKEHIYNHKCVVTGSKDYQNGVFTMPLPRPSYPSEGKTTFDVDNVCFPSTPPRSPGIDVSDDKDSEVVFAPKLEQLKLVEKTLCKRQRNKDVDVSAKREALRQCRKMPGARGSLLMAALDASKKNEGSLHKRSKKTVSSPRKNGKRIKHHRNLISRNLATSSFW